MKRYTIKNQTGKIEYFDIIKEIEDGYMIRLTQISDGYEKISDSFLNKQLFEMCLKTGYISQFENDADSVA